MFWSGTGRWKWKLRKACQPRKQPRKWRKACQSRQSPRFHHFHRRVWTRFRPGWFFCHRFLYAFLTAGSQAHCGSDEAFGRLGENESWRTQDWREVFLLTICYSAFAKLLPGQLCLLVPSFGFHLRHPWNHLPGSFQILLRRKWWSSTNRRLLHHRFQSH